MTDMTFEKLDLREFVTLNLNCIHFFGYFFPRFEKSSKKKVFYYIYALFFVGFALILSFISQMAKMIESFGDMEKMTEASFLLLTNLVQSIKIVVFNIYRPRVWQLVESMNREAFKPRNVEQYNMLLREIKKSKLITISFLIACVITCASWGISPLLDTTVTNGRKLPLSGWYPFETEASPIFELTYAYQMFVTTVGGLGNISMDTFLSGCIMNLSAQISVLNNALENMKSQQVNTDEKTNESLIKNVVHHRNILQFAEEFTNLFTTCITGMFVVGVIIVCISMFQMSLVPVLSFRFLAMLLYQICILEEMYLWCYYGNEVILKSNKLTESAYKCQWIDSSKEFKQHLLYFMTRTQIPLNLYSSGYFVLSLETFKAIVKSSWSYFAVLNQVHSKQID